ncbi:MAG: hypothetical protein WDW36_005013 [Sanguina aurantia]
MQMHGAVNQTPTAAVSAGAPGAIEATHSHRVQPAVALEPQRADLSVQPPLPQPTHPTPTPTPTPTPRLRTPSNIDHPSSLHSVSSSRPSHPSPPAAPVARPATASSLRASCQLYSGGNSALNDHPLLLEYLVRQVLADGSSSLAAGSISPGSGAGVELAARTSSQPRPGSERVSGIPTATQRMAPSVESRHAVCPGPGLGRRVGAQPRVTAPRISGTAAQAPRFGGGGGSFVVRLRDTAAIMAARQGCDIGQLVGCPDLLQPSASAAARLPSQLSPPQAHTHLCGSTPETRGGAVKMGCARAFSVAAAADSLVNACTPEDTIRQLLRLSERLIREVEALRRPKAVVRSHSRVGCSQDGAAPTGAQGAAEQLCSRSTCSGADSADKPTNPKPTASNNSGTTASRLELDDTDDELVRLRREVKTLQMENQNVFWLADEVKRLKRELLAMTAASATLATA